MVEPRNSIILYIPGPQHHPGPLQPSCRLPQNSWTPRRRRSFLHVRSGALLIRHPNAPRRLTEAHVVLGRPFPADTVPANSHAHSYPSWEHSSRCAQLRTGAAPSATRSGPARSMQVTAHFVTRSLSRRVPDFRLVGACPGVHAAISCSSLHRVTTIQCYDMPVATQGCSGRATGRATVGRAWVTRPPMHGDEHFLISIF
jgi:hypothetical protein